jgi:thioredoxin 1
MELTNSNYDFISNKEISIVNFYVNWCFYCKIQKLILTKFNTVFGNKAKIYDINSDENQTLAEELNVKSFPSILIFKDGNIVTHLTGLQNSKTLTETLNKYIL